MDTRWYVNIDNAGMPALLFRTTWQQGALTSESVWNKRTEAWQDSQIVTRALIKSDAYVFEVEPSEAQEILRAQKGSSPTVNKSSAE
jgi:hypothetical protein